MWAHGLKADIAIDYSITDYPAKQINDNSDALMRTRQRVPEAGCEMKPQWSHGIVVFVPLTLAQVHQRGERSLDNPFWHTEEVEHAST